MKQEVDTENQSEFGMEADETNEFKDKDDQAAERIEIGDEKEEEVNVEKEIRQPQDAITARAEEIKKTADKTVDEVVNVTNVDERCDNYSDAFEEVTLVEDIVADTKPDHSETIEECFDLIENEAQITEGVLEFPIELADSQESNQVAKQLSPNRLENVESLKKPESDEHRLNKV